MWLTKWWSFAQKKYYVTEDVKLPKLSEKLSNRYTMTRAVWKIEKFKYSKKTNDFQWDSQNDEVLQKKFFPKVLIFIGFFNFMGLKWFLPYIRANWGPLKCEFVKFESLLTFYISKLIPVIGKFIATHLSIRLVCQGPPRPLERDLRAPRGPMNCDLSSLKVTWHVIYQNWSQW